jgi:YegS/Rv2252/BmrU family lipid kinase
MWVDKARASDPCKSVAICGQFFLPCKLNRAMRRALLLYNPESGRRRHRRLTDVRAAAAALQAAGVELIVEPTREPGSAALQAREGMTRGCDAVIVCGGDGSVNEVLPAVVGTEVALGVIPLGTSNGLASDLGLPKNPAQAARLLASATPRPTAVPQVEHTRADGQRQSRYWIMGAGIGADAYMVYRLTLAFKQRWGMAAYYMETTRQWLTHDFPLFTAEFRQAGGEWRREQVSELLAIRITYFGGLMGRLVPGAALVRPDFQLVLFKTRSRVSFLRYMTCVWSNRPYLRPDIEILPATECRCLTLETGNRKLETRIYAEADGELLGTLPVSLSMSDKTVNLLVPRTAAAKFAVL